MQSGALRWEQELYAKFVYEEPKPFFHTLETDDGVVGVSFADVAEAKEMLATVLYAKSASPALANGPAPAKSSPAAAKPAVVKEEKKKDKKPKEKKKGGFFSNLFGRSEPEPEIEFSKPTNFRHKSHIGWDPEKGFDLDNIPADWKKLFQQAGIKKSELRDVNTANFVMGLVTEAMAQDDGAGSPPTEHAPQAPTGPAPVPPTMGGGGGPPPPPPPPAGGGPRAPPPPPPGGGHGGAGAGAGAGAGMGGPPAPAPPAPSNDARGGLLSQIQAGTSLRKVDSADVPDLNKLDQAKANDLASILASAMNNRRGDMTGDEVEDVNDEWSE